jgi:hypothetical protein
MNGLILQEKTVIPRYQIGDALLFRYVPFDYIDPQTGATFTITPEIPCTVLSIAHNFDQDIQTDPATYLPRVNRAGWIGFYYFVEIDQEEATLLGLSLTYPKGSPLTTDVIRENQIVGERIAF